MAESLAKSRPGYNERLFSGNLRGRLHTARFDWLRGTLDRLALAPQSVIELGCYDGRAVSFLPRMPARYIGFDAGWENGLQLAAQRWAGQSHLEFRQCRQADQMNLAGEKFDLAIALETLEHIPPQDLDPYLETVAASLNPGGAFLVSVPNEIGPVFAAKHLLKLAFIGGSDPYSLREFLFQALGLVEKVERREHKGFSYRRLIKTLRKYFYVEKAEGIPFAALPPYLSFGVGIVCRPLPNNGSAP
ncbi:MAG: class I SAM-dependent methyltransferase [Alphaproteobacteria bacterium]